MKLREFKGTNRFISSTRNINVRCKSNDLKVNKNKLVEASHNLNKHHGCFDRQKEPKENPPRPEDMAFPPIDVHIISDAWNRCDAVKITSDGCTRKQHFLRRTHRRVYTRRRQRDICPNGSKDNILRPTQLPFHE